MSEEGVSSSQRGVMKNEVDSSSTIYFTNESDVNGSSNKDTRQGFSTFRQNIWDKEGDLSFLKAQEWYEFTIADKKGLEMKTRTAIHDGKRIFEDKSTTSKKTFIVDQSKDVTYFVLDCTDNAGKKRDNFLYFDREVGGAQYELSSFLPVDHVEALLSTACMRREKMVQKKIVVKDS